MAEKMVLPASILRMSLCSFRTYTSVEICGNLWNNHREKRQQKKEKQKHNTHQGILHYKRKPKYPERRTCECYTWKTCTVE